MASTCDEARPRWLSRLLLLLAMAVVALPAVGRDVAPSAAQDAPERSVTVTPDSELEGWDQVTVRWSGFPPNQPVTISQYGSSGVTARWNRLPVYTGPDGTGEAVFTIGLGSSCFGPNGSCRIVVSDCASRAADGSWGYTHFQEPSGPGWASTAIGIAEPPQEDPDTGDFTNPAIAAPPAPPPPPPEERGPLPTITRPAPSAVTGAPQAELVEAWRDDVVYGTGSTPFTFDFTPINTPTAVEELIAGSIDFAVTGSTPTAEQLASLEAAGRPVVAVPLAADGLVFVQDRRSVATPDSSGFDLRTISAATAASLFELTGGSDINDALTADNRGCEISSLDITSYRFTRFIYRADRSATNHLLLSWLNERGLRSAEPSTVIDLGQGSFTGVNGGDEVVSRFIRRVGEGEGGDEVYRRIGYVSRSTAARDGLAMLDLALPDGQHVRPTDEAIAAALTGRPIDSATAIDTDLATTAPGTWPLSYVHYALVPAHPSGSLTADELAVIRDLVGYALSPAGQMTAAERGYTPLPPEVLALAEERAATITLEPPAVPPAPGPVGTPESAAPSTAGDGRSGPFAQSSSARPTSLAGGLGGLGADTAVAAPTADKATTIVATRQSRPFLLGRAGLVPRLVVIMGAGLLAVVLGCLPRARARAMAAARALRERST